jgi:hypothetical protein
MFQYSNFKETKKMIKTFIFTAIIIAASISFANAQEIPVKIYLMMDRDVVSPERNIESVWVSVTRTGNAKSPLRSALELLFRPMITEQERKQNIYEVTFGMNFEGVSLKNGTATVRFSETKESNYGTLSAGIFSEAIEKTAKQFRAVKRVRICVVGETNIDGESEVPYFSRCKK